VEIDKQYELLSDEDLEAIFNESQEDADNEE
jgi:hypothetical protein